MTFQTFERSVKTFVKSLDALALEQVQVQAARVVNETLAASPVRPAYRVTIGKSFSKVFDGELPPLNLSVAGGNSAVHLYFDHRREVALESRRILLRNSPELTGDYKKAFTLYVNGQEVESFEQGLREIVPGATVRIINKAPYARKLEVGKQADGSPFVMTVEPGMVERAVGQVAASRYKKLADVYFTFSDISDAYILKGREVGTTYVDNLGNLVPRYNRPDRRAGSPINYPALIIGERQYVVRNR